MQWLLRVQRSSGLHLDVIAPRFRCLFRHSSSLKWTPARRRRWPGRENLSNGRASSPPGWRKHLRRVNLPHQPPQAASVLHDERKRAILPAILVRVLSYPRHVLRPSANIAQLWSPRPLRSRVLGLVDLSSIYLPNADISSEFDFRVLGDGRSASARYANNSNYRNDSLIRKESRFHGRASLPS
jgi:hypothetical protein